MCGDSFVSIKYLSAGSQSPIKIRRIECCVPKLLSEDRRVGWTLFCNLGWSTLQSKKHTHRHRSQTHSGIVAA